VTVTAGVDVGNATTEVAFLDGDRLLGADRVATRGRKGSADSLRGAAALVRRLERRLGCRAGEARVAPLRAADTTTLTIPAAPPATGRLRLVTAGVTTPGGTGAWVGAPLWLDRPLPPVWSALHVGVSGVPPAAGVGFPPAAGAGVPSGAGPAALTAPRPAASPAAASPAAGPPAVAIVPASLGYARAAERLRALLSAGVPVGAVLAAGDEGVLIANRLYARLPVIDQVDLTALRGAALIAVEVRRPGEPLTLLADPVALAAAFSLSGSEAWDAAALCRTLVDFSNAVVGCAALAGAAGTEAGGWACGAPAGAAVVAGRERWPESEEPWVVAAGERIALRLACARAQGWPVGTVRVLGTPEGEVEVDDLFALDLAAVADAATARRGSLGSAALVASLRRMAGGADHARTLADLLDLPVHSVLTEPAAARLGALTTPGARPDAVVVDLGAGTVDVIAPDAEVVAAGAGGLLTAAVAETLGIPRAAADWVKRGPCLRVDGGQRFEAEDGSRGFLDRPAPAAAAGMLAVRGPAGLLPFDRRHSPSEWRAIRLRLKEAVLAANLRRALGTLGAALPQVLIVGGPAGDDELLGVLLRSLPGDVPVGRASVGGTLSGAPVGHRYAAAVGLAMAGSAHPAT
jgi:Diol dehydratase reactivase ATPase-like domain/DD-reactivating factor swiveling domain